MAAWWTARAARRLRRDEDVKDTPFVALALQLGGPLWTAADELETGLRAKGCNRFFEP